MELQDNFVWIAGSLELLNHAERAQESKAHACGLLYRQLPLLTEGRHVFRYIMIICDDMAFSTPASLKAQQQWPAAEAHVACLLLPRCVGSPKNITFRSVTD